VWSDVQGLLDRLRDEGAIEAAAIAVADELRYYLGLHEPPDDPLLDSALPLLQKLGPAIAVAIHSSAHSVPSITRRNQTHCIQGTVVLKHGGRDVMLWVAFTPARSTYNPTGWPTAIQIAFFPEFVDADLASVLLGAGYRPLAGGLSSWRPYRVYRRWSDLAQLAPEEQLRQAVEWALAMLARVGVVAQSTATPVVHPASSREPTT
jgi:hypothetical protein